MNNPWYAELSRIDARVKSACRYLSKRGANVALGLAVLALLYRRRAAVLGLLRSAGS